MFYCPSFERHAACDPENRNQTSSVIASALKSKRRQLAQIVALNVIAVSSQIDIVNDMDMCIVGPLAVVPLSASLESCFSKLD
jgi:hypothetical protein